jgi:polysaccharide export outer membrane protein
MQKPGFYIPSYKDSVSFEDYELRTGDRLFVRVYSTDEQTNTLFNGTSNIQMMQTGTNPITDLYTYLIEDNGAIVFPMIGEVQLLGKTLRQASLALEMALDPIFKFKSVEMRVINHDFSVIGGGKAVYITMPQEKINIFKALALAGDLGIYSDRGKIRLLRETKDGVKIKVFDVRSADIIHSEYFYVEPNDVIYIQDLKEKFWGITNLPIFISTFVSTVSFGVLIYDAAFKKEDVPVETTGE